jgi:hypothetical protein
VRFVGWPNSLSTSCGIDGYVSTTTRVPCRCSIRRIMSAAFDSAWALKKLASSRTGVVAV